MTYTYTIGLLPLLLLATYLVGAVLTARLVYRDTDGGRALIGAPGETLAVCFLTVVGWPVFAVLVFAVAAINRANGGKA